MRHRLISQAEALARRWMPGDRQGKPGVKARKAWEHPADLVALLEERPGEFSEAGQIKAIAIAWMHDLIEDGRKEDGSRVTASDLEGLVVGYEDPRADPYLDPMIVEGVIQLTHPEGLTKIAYYETLAAIDYIPKLVKCVDRICNLREGADVFKPARWDRYVHETRTYILPLAQALREETAEWLTKHLHDAMALRVSS